VAATGQAPVEDGTNYTGQKKKGRSRLKVFILG